LSDQRRDAPQRGLFVRKRAKAVARFRIPYRRRDEVCEARQALCDADW
jgi:hypothetical protein